MTALRIRELADQLAVRWQDSPPDLVHAHSWAAGVAAQASGRELNLPQVQTFYSLAVQDGPRAGARRARLELALARSARAVLVGASAESSALARLGVPQAAIRVVPPGVDTGLFQPDGPTADRGDRPRLLMVVTSLAADRGPAAALHALAAVPGTELFIAGGPPAAELAGDPGHQALSPLAGQLGVADRVTFTGQVTRAGVPALMRSADVLLNLSAGEHDGPGDDRGDGLRCPGHRDRHQRAPGRRARRDHRLPDGQHPAGAAGPPDPPAAGQPDARGHGHRRGQPRPGPVLLGSGSAPRRWPCTRRPCPPRPRRPGSLAETTGA